MTVRTIMIGGAATSRKRRMPYFRSRSCTTAYAPEPAWVSAYRAGGSRSSTSASAACFQTSEIFPKCRLAMIRVLPACLLR